VIKIQATMDVSNLAKLFEALFSCFVIIILGYSAGRLNIITHTQSQGVGNFVGKFDQKKKSWLCCCLLFCWSYK